MRVGAPQFESLQDKKGGAKVGPQRGDRTLPPAFSQEDTADMSSSAALKVLFALAVIWASYETSIALDNETLEQGSSTVETEITAATTTVFSDADEQQSTTANDGASTPDVFADITTEATALAKDNSLEINRQFVTSNEESRKEENDLEEESLLLDRWGGPDDKEGNETATLNDEWLEGSENGRNILAPNFSGYIYELDTTADGSLQDITDQESRLNTMYMNFESMKETKGENKTVYNGDNGPELRITSYLADSDSAIAMTSEELLNDARNKTLEADVISAFFIAPEEEANEIDKNQYSGHPIVVNNLNEDLVRNERFTGKEETKTLTNDILAPIQAAVSLSRGDEGPVIEKQILHQGPVYKTFIEIQKSIPYEIKELTVPKGSRVTANKELGATQFNDVTIYPSQANELNQHSQIANELPIYPRNPTSRQSSVYYRYPMYYVPHRNSGNHGIRNSYDNGVYHQTRPILPVQYLLTRYQPQAYDNLILAQPYTVSSDSKISGLTDSNGFESDQNHLQSEHWLQYIQQTQGQHPPFRPSHPVYASQYPPYTYHVMSTMRGRAGHARRARSKQLRIEYGGFKPPMVPSIQIDDEELTNPIDGNISADEKS